MGSSSAIVFVFLPVLMKGDASMALTWRVLRSPRVLAPRSMRAPHAPRVAAAPELQSPQGVAARRYFCKQRVADVKWSIRAQRSLLLDAKDAAWHSFLSLLAVRLKIIKN